MKDYYSILEISKNADLLILKKAYRKLAIQYHPDKNSSTEASQLFIEITEAYEVLKSPESRKEYDILYVAFYNKTATSSATTNEQAWQDSGRQKAKEYSAIPLDDFISRIIDEVKIGARYGFKFLLIAFCIFALITSPVAFSVDPFFGFFYLVLYTGLGYLLFNRTSKDYQNDRKRKFNN